MRKLHEYWVPAALLVAAVWAWIGLDIDAARLSAAGQSVGNLARDAFPPDWGVWDAAWPALIETIQIAILATLFGFIFSVPLALFATRILWPTWITTPARLLASGVRVLPSILWAIVMVIVFGFGPLAGVAAMTLYTIGYLAKLQYEAFEGLPRDSLDAIRAMGATRFQVAWHAVLPEAGNALRSQALFMFEYNVRSSTIIGVVGAGGIGRLVSQYLRFFQYDRVVAILIMLFATVVIIDWISIFVRRRFLEVDAPRASWRDVLLPWKGRDA